MEKHNPDQLTAPAVIAAQAAQQNQNQSQAQGQVGAHSRIDSADGGTSRTGGGGAGGGQQGQSQSNYSQTETISCPFDLHQYKTVSTSDIQYKPVSVADITSHKDLCLTVSASTIQVEHLNSWGDKEVRNNSRKPEMEERKFNDTSNTKRTLELLTVPEWWFEVDRTKKVTQYTDVSTLSLFFHFSFLPCLICFPFAYCN